eukprot:c54561_g1_i1 orf=133-309(+)
MYELRLGMWSSKKGSYFKFLFFFFKKETQRNITIMIVHPSLQVFQKKEVYYPFFEFSP